MVAAGGRHKVRAVTPMVVLALAASLGLAGCEVADDVGVPGTDIRPSTRATAPQPQPTQDPKIAAKAKRNQSEVDRILGAQPADLMMGASGGIGFRSSIRHVDSGKYFATVACAGTPNALLTISQNGLRDGGTLDLNVECGKAVQSAVELKSGPVTVQVVRNSTDPGLGAAVGFRLTNRPPS